MVDEQVPAAPGKRTGFIEEATPGNLAKLDRLGETLAKVFVLERKKMDLYLELWKRYEIDCKRFGVVPRKRVQVR